MMWAPLVATLLLACATEIAPQVRWDCSYRLSMGATLCVPEGGSVDPSLYDAGAAHALSIAVRQGLGAAARKILSSLVIHADAPLVFCDGFPACYYASGNEAFQGRPSGAREALVPDRTAHEAMHAIDFAAHPDGKGACHVGPLWEALLLGPAPWDAIDPDHAALRSNLLGRCR